MKKTSNINIRIDKDVKEKSEQIFESMGINMSIAINLFLNQVIRVNGIPFEIKAPEQKEDEGNPQGDPDDLPGPLFLTGSPYDGSRYYQGAVKGKLSENAEGRNGPACQRDG